MPSSTSNFKNRLRLPRLFFADPSEEKSFRAITSGRFRRCHGAA